MSRPALQGAALQTYNQELLKCIDDMKRKRSDLTNSIDQMESERGDIQSEIEKLSYRLTQINDTLNKKTTAKEDYDRTITETESAYSKILESSQMLLTMVRRESVCLEQTGSKIQSNSHGSKTSRRSTDLLLYSQNLQ